MDCVVWILGFVVSFDDCRLDDVVFLSDVVCLYFSFFLGGLNYSIFV